MAVDKKISQLASGAPAQAGDEYVVARSGANYKLTLTNIAASMPPIGATTPNTGSFTSLTNSGNLTFSSTGQRITGDFGNATLANRVYFQNSTVNGNTDLMAVPNGTGTLAQVSAWSSNDPANSSLAALRVTAATDVRILSSIQGTGTFLPMTFYTGGSERMRLDTSGNLGIGASPSYRLDVQGGTASFTGSSGANAIRVAGAGGSWFWIDNPTTTTMRFSSGATAGTGAMVLDSSGNVGIGTASPGTKLDAYNSSTTSTLIRARNDTTSVYLDANNGYSYLNTFSNHPMLFGTNNTERMRITSAGEVNIGSTTSYGGLLSVNRAQSGGIADLLTLRDGSAGTTFNLQTYGDPAAGTANRFNYDGAYLAFRRGTTEQMRLTSANEFLVGTTTADGIISAERSGSNVITAKQNSAGGWCYKSNAFNNGGTYFHIEFLEQGTARGSIQSNGTNTSYNTTSDQRLKENIAPADDAGALVDAIQIVKHDWKAGGHTRYGVIAQDLHQVAPEAVAKGNDGNEVERPWGVDYSKLVPILVKEIQSLRARVAALEAK